MLGSKTTARTGGHFSDLDGMRGVLACLVMLMHFGMDRIIASATAGVIQSCEWGLSVDFFFVLSGLVLARSFQREPRSLRQYFSKRFLRLLPMFLLSVVAMLVLGARGDVWTVVANLFAVQSILGLKSLNYPSWSIPFELFIPILGLLAARRWVRWSQPYIRLVFVGLLVCAIASAVALAAGEDHRFARALSGIGLGMVTYRLWGERLSARPSSPLLISTLFLGILLVMLSAHRWPLAALMFHPLVIAILVRGASTRSFFSTAPCQALGRWSYSIYLLHIPVMTAAIVILGAPAVGHNPLMKLMLAGLTIFAASICYRFIERPMIQFANRWERGLQGSSAGGPVAVKG